MQKAQRSLGKGRRDRISKPAVNLRALRVWVPDTRSPGLAAEICSQCLAGLPRPGQRNNGIVLSQFGEAAAGLVMGWR